MSSSATMLCTKIIKISSLFTKLF